jgi:hypothetical protein
LAPDWTQAQDINNGATYFYTSIVSDGSTPTFSFELSVLAGTPLDYYDLALTFAWDVDGVPFYQNEHVYVNVNVVPEPQAYAMASGLALAAYAAYRRWRRRSRTEK